MSILNLILRETDLYFIIIGILWGEQSSKESKLQKAINSVGNKD